MPDVIANARDDFNKKDLLLVLSSFTKTSISLLDDADNDDEDEVAHNGQDVTELEKLDSVDVDVVVGGGGGGVNAPELVMKNDHTTVIIDFLRQNVISCFFRSIMDYNKATPRNNATLVTILMSAWLVLCCYVLLLCLLVSLLVCFIDVVVML